MEGISVLLHGLFWPLSLVESLPLFLYALYSILNFQVVASTLWTQLVRLFPSLSLESNWVIESRYGVVLYWKGPEFERPDFEGSLQVWARLEIQKGIVHSLVFLHPHASFSFLCSGATNCYDIQIGKLGLPSKPALSSASKDGFLSREEHHNLRVCQFFAVVFCEYVQ